jgi:hypothetical protein
MTRLLAATLKLAACLALGLAMSAAPRVAHATPGKDACNGMLEWSPDFSTIGVYGPGTWCMDHDIVVTTDYVDDSFALVSVHMDDITIDCRGHLLEYTGTSYFSYGIVPQDGSQRLTVRNCRFRGFTTAVYASGDGYLIEDNVVDASRGSPFGDGTAISGTGSGTIRRNRIHDAIGRGIYADGSANVTDNLVDGVTDVAFGRQAIGIQVDMAEAAEVSRNTIRGLLPSNEADQHIAIMVNSDVGGARTRVEDNVLVEDGLGGSIGVMCSANARVSDNVITGFIGGTASCSDVADNDESP